MFLANWIYHYQNKYRYLAYILFTISVQLKLFPLMFIHRCLLSDWQDWRNNLKAVDIGCSEFCVAFCFRAFRVP